MKAKAFDLGLGIPTLHRFGCIERGICYQDVNEGRYAPCARGLPAANISTELPLSLEDAKRLGT